MKKLLFVIFLLAFVYLLLPDSYVHAQETDKKTPNVIFISLDGVSRQTLYDLIHKSKLPNLFEISSRGNYRNLTVREPITPQARYIEMLTGYEEFFVTNPKTPTAPLTIPAEFTVFAHLTERVPSIQIGVIFSTIENPHLPTRLSHLFSALSPERYALYPETHRTEQEISEIALFFLEQRNPACPFFLFMNFTTAEKAAHRYREGAACYSESIQKSDTAIGHIIRYLKDTNLWENTEFIITADYGFQPKTKNFSSETDGWIISSKKILFKGSSADIVPTLYKIYEIPPYFNNPLLKGRPLI